MGVDAVLKLREMGHGGDVAGKPVRAASAKCPPTLCFCQVLLKIIL